MRVFGAADEFWRVRMTRVDTTEELDFEWHDDILYRQPRVAQAADVELWHVEAVRVDDAENNVRLATFDTEADARDFLMAVTDDLHDMTKSRFEEHYLTRLPSPEPYDDPDA